MGNKIHIKIDSTHRLRMKDKKKEKNDILISLYKIALKSKGKTLIM